VTVLEVPSDPWAEAAITGCAIASIRGADLAQRRLRADDLWDPRLRRMFVAAVELEQIGEEDRIPAVADATSIPEAEVARLVNDRPVMWDLSGGFARRVRDAASRRAAMGAAARVYNAIAAGARLEEVAAEIHQLEQAVGPC